MSGLTFCLLLSALQVVAQATSAPQAPAPSVTHPTSQPSKFDEALRRIEQRAAEVHDLSARFTQLKRTPLLKKPLQSEGTLRIKSDSGKALVRWDTTKPAAAAATILTTPTELRILYPRQELLEIYPLESGLAQLAASPLPQLDLARKFFKIEAYEGELDGKQRIGDHIGVRLTPIEEDLRQHVLEVRLLIDTQTAFIINAQIEYPDDERLSLTFEEVRINTGLSDRDFELNVGPEVKVVRPLDQREGVER